MLILGIETSCDETSAAVVKEGKEILSHIIASQVDLHAKFGGVVPEIASRKQLEFINPVIQEALKEAKISFEDLNGVAVANGPGLLGSLLVGVTAAKTIALVFDLPLIGVNHLEGHIYANFLAHPSLEPPLISLVASGGHTLLVFMKDHCQYQILGQTRDDAAGEAFDKIARAMNLGYPGGPAIDKLSKEGDMNSIPLPRPFLEKGSFDFSFSGLKTAVLRYISKTKEIDIKNLVASFQQAVVDVLVDKTLRAAEEKRANKITLAGGVAVNSKLRSDLQRKAAELNLQIYYPPPILCTDNAAMVACAGYYKLQKGKKDHLDLETVANLKLA